MLHNILDGIAATKYTTLHKPIWPYNQNLEGFTLLFFVASGLHQHGSVIT